MRQNELAITQMINCEDRLDLFQLIKSSQAPWGMDFPFSIPSTHLKKHYGGMWSQFIQDSYQDSRYGFKEKFGQIHSEKNNPSDYRITDLAVGGKSPIAATPIDMKGMLFGGRKLLYLLQGHSCVYPFEPY